MQAEDIENLTSSRRLEESKVYSVQDAQNFINYLGTVSSVLLNIEADLWNLAAHEDQNQFVNISSCILNKNLLTYLSDQSIKALIVYKYYDANEKLEVRIRNQFITEVLKSDAIAFVKRSNFTFSSEAAPNTYNSIIQMISVSYQEQNNGGANPYSVSHSFIQNCFLPLFNTFKTVVESSKNLDKQSHSELIKKFNDVNLSLIKCRQNVEIPEIVLQFDPKVREICQIAKQNNSKPTNEQIQSLNNPDSVKSLSENVLRWINDIQTIVDIKFELSSASVVDEINYWMSMERSMNFIDGQLKYPEVELTIEVLKHAKKFNITTQFEHAPIKKQLPKCINCNQFMKEFPINNLLTSSTLPELKSAVIQIFTHIKKLQNLADYPQQRAIQLLEALSRDFTQQVVKILKVQNIMFSKYPDFVIMMKEASDLFQTWDSEYKAFQQSSSKSGKSSMSGALLQRDQGGHTSQISLFEHVKLLKRSEEIQRIRRTHENLKEVIESIVSQDSKSQRDIAGFMTTKDISDAYQIFQSLDVFDISKEGDEALITAQKQYDQAIDTVESTITSKLRDSLGSATSAKEMFRIFGRFNKLFTRPRIKGAIQEYQTQLVKTVQKDIQMLLEKYKKQYQNSQNFVLARSRDIPLTAGYVIWAKQLQAKLKKYLDKVEQVLGNQWFEDPEGKKCKDIGDTFEKILDVTKILNDWNNDITNYKKNLDQNEKLLEVIQKRKNLEVRVNTEEKLSQLFKELRNLQNMKIRVNYSIQYISDEVKQNYPSALAMQEAVHQFTQICSNLNDRSAKLVANLRKEVQNTIVTGFNYFWSHKTQIYPYVKKFADQVIQLEQAVNGLNEKIAQIDALLESLKTCPAEQDVLNDKLSQIQKVIDELCFKNFSNLHIWIQDLDSQVEIILGERLTVQIKRWIDAFEHYDDIKEREILPDPTTFEVMLQDQLIYIEPPIEYGKLFWMQEFHRMTGSVCCLPRLVANRYDVNLNQSMRETWGSAKDNNYFTVLKRVSQDLLSEVYTRITFVFDNVDQYAKTWLSYQSLWELDAKKVQERLGDDINQWQQMLTDIKLGRQTFDNSQTEQHFGPIIIDYRMVQVKINNKYDSWHKELLSFFGNTFGEKLRNFNKMIRDEFQKLERVNFSNLQSDLMDAIVLMQYHDSMFMEWGSTMETFRNGQKVLDKQRFSYPNDWLSLSQVEQDWSNFKQLKNKREQQQNNELQNIQAKVARDEKSLNQVIEEIEKEWEEKQPGSGELLPAEALEVLKRIGNKLWDIKEKYEKCCRAKELLKMEPGNPQKLEILEEQVQSLSELWTELNRVWTPIEKLRDSTLLTLKNKTLKDAADEALKEFNSLPIKLRSYEGFEKMKVRLTQFNKMNKLIMELKTEAMKDRHWKIFLSKIKITESVSEVTLGQIWAAEILRIESQIRDLMTVASGELVLESMVHQVKSYWEQFELELAKYQTKCKLIRGWDDLFTKLDEDLNNLQSMKMSPYYKTFESDIAQWDDKLQKMKLTFDTWIDVQRKWVYLEGIFFGPSDIKTQLSNEYNKFKSVDNEFTGLMKKVANKPLVVEVMSIQQLQKTLERQSESLQRIQKALGDYLETQRQAFARFYFVGDDDLLDIIGNSRDVTNVQRHFPKMYAGIVLLQSEKEGNDDVVLGMCSREGEAVKFVKPVKIAEDPRINIWLGKVDAEMMNSLAVELDKSVQDINKTTSEDQLKVIEDHPAQIILLALQVNWCFLVEQGFLDPKKLVDVVQYVLQYLTTLAESVLKDHPKSLRQKFEQIITDFVHQRDVTRQLINTKVTNRNDFGWQYHMRFNWNVKETDVGKKLLIQMGNASFHYGFEYLGVAEKLVQTPLTDRCFLTLTQALHLRMGGSPFGPAGTGKTESVKALGAQLGRFVLVFNCDETFDFNAMGRIFVGLCQVGAWGCFDEFNRLEERMLSACSQQILMIQTGLREKQKKIELMSKEVNLNSQMGCFVTMNPGYAGRSNLPENLKQLFRQMAMVKPDRELIAQVMLYSQGFRTAERLAGKIVSLFELCADQLSSQPHYDFGLRALKSVLNSAGNMKRQEMIDRDQKPVEQDELEDFEQRILLRSVCDTVVPKLIQDDIPLLSTLLAGVFPGSSIPQIKEQKLREELQRVCDKHNYLATQNFIEKVLQLYQIQRISHGVMLVGPCGCGKSAAWRVLLESLQGVDKVKGDYYIVDPKAINKDELYGRLDNTTLEWTDGVFTSILRKILANQRGESTRRHWIIFDGDVDPEWAENLNSVLDDNKLLTLPNGERLSIPPNVRMIFEVETLKYATLATVSRCGMVWFSEETIDLENIFFHFLQRLGQQDYDSTDEDKSKQTPDNAVRQICVKAIEPLFNQEQVMHRILEIAQKNNYKHVMEFTRIRVLESSFALIRRAISNVIEYNDQHSEIPLENQQIQQYMEKQAIIAIMWGVAGSLNLHQRGQFSEEISQVLPNSFVRPQFNNSSNSFIDFEVTLPEGEWQSWKTRVPQIEIDPSKITEADTIIETVDTLRHKEVLCGWLSEHRPFLLCGPPGSGKTMTLMSTLKALVDFEMIFINFSSSTSPLLILKQFDHYCEYVKTTNGFILRPKQPNKWLVVFCDEINLPDTDKYGTIAVITFLRQLTEQHGFWRSSDRQWISLERIQFVGACNPPTDMGRKPLSPRFLRHTPLILVDFPGPESLRQIFGTFNRAMLKKTPTLKQHWEPLTYAMVDFYTRSQQHFTSDMQAHYIYSPRELTRWKYALNEALEPLESLEDLIRLWAHEALRLFQDRLVHPNEKEWCDKLVDEVANQHFQGFNEKALERPILFSNYLHRVYQSVNREELRKHIQGKLRIFNEEQLNVQLVVFDDVLDNILRIDRVLRQPLGHLLLVGASGVGKTTLTRFVSWMNNLSVHQIKAGRDYSLLDFDQDLRDVMKRAGVKGEKITFIFDESNVLGPAFLEKMNALLASGEIPGLFEGDELNKLNSEIREAQSRDNKMIDTEDQLYKNFTNQVQRNLHVVFTMNPANPDFSNRTASSPALFNRCVINWFGDWNKEALYQVAKDFTLHVEVPDESFIKKPALSNDDPNWGHEVLVNSLVYIQQSVVELNRRLAKSAKRFNYITPRDFLDLINHFKELHTEKKNSLQDQQLHLNVGLDKLRETENQVREMQQQLDLKKIELEKKEKEAGEKLQSILSEQKWAENKKETASRLKEEAKVKSSQMKEREQIVNRELEDVAPRLRKAEEAVKNITTAELAQIKSYANPPELVRITMEAVICSVTNTNKKVEWNFVKTTISKSDFIKSILQFQTDSLKPEVKKFVLSNYLENKEKWNTDKIIKASNAAGQLAVWLESQINYADILMKMDPLRQEVNQLKTEGNELQMKIKEYEEEVMQAENKIKTLQQEYQELIAQQERIKVEMKSVGEKVGRSKSLILNLSSEKIRWEESAKNFKHQIQTIIGDVLLSAAFLTYTGFFDHFYRKVINNTWKDIIQSFAQIRMRQELSLIEFLSKGHDRLIWQSHTLPSDDLCMENAIILEKFHRYPLVIDPSGQALSFLTSYLKEKKLTKTSFTDEGFLKTLESCLRFGYPLLVQDVEKIDPILNSVLNKEIYKTGGRTLIRVGNQDIDFTKSFNMFMITRDSSARFTPDLCSRVTFVNFTVTQSSLQEQCLNIYLRNESPETEDKRIRLMKLQGECIVRIRELEDGLLDSLNNVQGSILEDESVIKTMEKLKQEAQVVQAEMKQSDNIMYEVESVTKTYVPLSSSTSKIFFALSSLANIHFLYQFSLSFFMDTIYNVLNKTEELNKVSKNDLEKRRTIIFNNIFTQIYRRMNSALLFEDKVVFAAKLVEVKLGESTFAGIWRNLFKSSSLVQSSLSPDTLGGKLNPIQLKNLESLTEHDQFKKVLDHIRHQEEKWLTFMNSEAPENEIPTGWEVQQLSQPEKLNWVENNAAFSKEFSSIQEKLSILKVLRADRFQILLKALVNLVAGERIMDEMPIDMKWVVEKETTSRTPVLLCSAPGFDPSFKVEQLAKEMGVKLTSVAIGSAEGFKQAEVAVDQGARTGSWVMLKNVHLATSWLNDFEKKLFGLNPHQNFRIFLTMEFNPKVPATLIRQSYKLVFEPPVGIKASLTRTYKTVLSTQRSDKAPAERARLHFLLAWLHAVILERLRFTPVGWTKAYEFNEADQRCSLDLIDEYIDGIGQKSNIDPKNLPWDAFRAILTQNLYGGKVDNEYDSKILQSLVEQFFTEKSFDPKHPLFVAGEGREHFTVPDGIKYHHFMQWVEQLPNSENPEWSGLPSNVERVQSEFITQQLIHKVLSLQQEAEEEISTIELPEMKQKKMGKQQKSEQVQWLQDVLERVNRYQSILPKSMNRLDRSGDSMNDPLFRFLEREITVVSALLKQVQSNLTELQNLAEGKTLATNVLRNLARDVYSDTVPTGWKKYTVINLGLNDWVMDFKKRLEQFSKYSQTPEYQTKGVWFGGLLFPEAFLTATRQYVAQNNKWSLEELELQLVPSNEEVTKDCFVIYGASMEGATLNSSDLSVTIVPDVSVPLNKLTFKWSQIKEQRGFVGENEIMIPVYLNKLRKNLVFSFKVKLGINSRQTLYQKGLAMILFN